MTVRPDAADAQEMKQQQEENQEYEITVDGHTYWYAYDKYYTNIYDETDLLLSLYGNLADKEVRIAINSWNRGWGVGYKVGQTEIRAMIKKALAI